MLLDLLFDRQDDAVTICEMKFSDKPFSITKDYVEKLKQKITTYKQVSRTDKQIFLALISANGVQKNKYSQEMVDYEITMKDLLEK